ncbi:MAG TPA: hypothetical protein DDY68_04520, partial [Porphyromonadaceae bacterium]|nr:hypothetical protein [Porphyromonadaceae bacterium]
MKDSASNPVYCCNDVPGMYVNEDQKTILSFDVTTIGDFTFYNLRSLKEIIFGKALDTIGKGAFWDCNLSSTKSRGSISDRKDSLDLTLTSIRVNPPKLDKEAFSIMWRDTTFTDPTGKKADTIKKVFRRANNVICHVLNEKAQNNYFSTEWGKHFYIRDYQADAIYYPYGDNVCQDSIGRGNSPIGSTLTRKRLWFSKITEADKGNGILGTCKLVARKETWDTTATGDRIGYLCEHNFVRWDTTNNKIIDTATWNGSNWYRENNVIKKKKGKITIPDTITTEEGTFKVIGIWNSAFANCLDLDTILLEENKVDTVSIEPYAFDSCANLKHINIPEKTLALGTFSFNNCLKLDSIDFHKLRTIGEYAFINCPLNRKDTLIMGDSIRNIERGAFARTKMRNLLVKQPKNTLSIQEGAFLYNDSLRSVTIKTGEKRGENPVKLYQYAFSCCDTLKTLSLGNNVSLAEEGIFYMCKSLDSVAFPMYATKIGDYA